MTARGKFAAAARRQRVELAARAGLVRRRQLVVYVSGPISGMPEGNRAAFAEAARRPMPRGAPRSSGARRWCNASTLSAKRMKSTCCRDGGRAVAHVASTPSPARWACA